jgi:hypothetical protein
LFEVSLEDGSGIIFEDVEISEHIANSPIPVSGFTLGAVDLLVDDDVSPAVFRKHVENALINHFLVLTLDQTDGGDGSGIDHGIHGLACLGT